MTAFRGLFVKGTAATPSVGTTPIEARLAIASLLAENAPGVPRNGLLFQGTTNVVTATATTSPWSYNISAINPVFQRTAGEGAYMWSLVGTTPANTIAAPATNSRWDLIYVMQDDIDKGDPDNNAVVGVVNGVAAAAPTKPYSSVPAGAYVLAEAQIFAGTTSTNNGANTLTQVWRHTVPRGVPIPVRSLAERGEITPVLGTMVRRLDIGPTVVESYDGTTWRLPAAAQGRLYFNRVTGSAAPVNALTVISTIPSFTFRAGRKYRLVWESDWLSSLSGMAGAFYISTAATTDAAAATTGLTNLQVRDAWAASAAASSYMHVEAYYEPTVDTTVQIKFLAQADGNAGTVQIQSNRVGGTTYAIYDEGAQY